MKKGWTRQSLRAVQCILRPMHGVVGPKKAYFEFAFGKNVDEFLGILELSEEEICSRGKSGSAEAV